MVDLVRYERSAIEEVRKIEIDVQEVKHAKSNVCRGKYDEINGEGPVCTH